MITYRFPDDFLFGTGSSAMQIEGSPYADGKGENTWDYATRVNPERFADAAKTEPAASFYKHFEEDIKEMKAQGLTSFRFSISWSRILPEGTGRINPVGIAFYNRVIDLLIENGIEPFVDIFHWDLPLVLANEGGFKNRKIIDYFVEFASVCFQNFGDRVKLWSTINEPSVFCFAPYTEGRWYPYEESLQNGLQAAHNTLICHFRTVKLYREMGLQGKIGAVLAIVPIMPLDPSGADLGAARRQMDRICDWWLRPMFEGKYPDKLLEECPEYRDAMPFCYAEELLREFVPMDMVGLNYYCPGSAVYKEDELTKSNTVENYYVQEGQKFENYPAGLYDAMLYVTERYHSPEIYITENGLGMLDSGDVEKELNDEERIRYLREHLRMVVRSIRAGANIKGYYYWSNTDSFECRAGYRYRFGLTYIDWESGKRIHKKSWSYYKKIIEMGMVD